MYTLKRCPLCGSEAKLEKTKNGYLTAPNTTIADQWEVKCTNKDCNIYVNGRTEIYQNDEGKICINLDGAKIAVDKWNNRVGESE